MDTAVCVAAEKAKRLYALSPSVSVQWHTETIYCGFRASYEITLVGIPARTDVRIFCRTNGGEYLDSNDVFVSSTCYRGKVLIPFNAEAGSKVYLEIQLPEYGIVCKSSGRPVHTSIPTSATEVTDETCEVTLDAVRAQLAAAEINADRTARRMHILHSGISHLWHGLKSLSLF